MYGWLPRAPLIASFSGVSNLGYDRLGEWMEFSDFLEAKFWVDCCWKCSKSTLLRWVEMSSFISSFSVSSTAFVQNASWNFPFLILYWVIKIKWGCHVYLLGILGLSQGSAFSLGLQQVRLLHAHRLLSMIDLIEHAILPLTCTSANSRTGAATAWRLPFPSDVSTLVLGE